MTISRPVEIGDTQSMRIIPLGLLCCLFLIGAALAEENNLRKLMQLYDKGTLADQKYVADELTLIELGMAYANAELSNHNRTPLYCTPVHLSLNGQQLVDILKQQLEITPAAGALPTAAVLLQALKRVFPCHN